MRPSLNSVQKYIFTPPKKPMTPLQEGKLLYSNGVFFVLSAYTLFMGIGPLIRLVILDREVKENNVRRPDVSENWDFTTYHNYQRNTFIKSFSIMIIGLVGIVWSIKRYQSILYCPPKSIILDVKNEKDNFEIAKNIENRIRNLTLKNVKKKHVTKLKEEYKSLKLNPKFQCPISYDFMRHPLKVVSVDEDGKTWEKTYDFDVFKRYSESNTLDPYYRLPLSYCEIDKEIQSQINLEFEAFETKLSLLENSIFRRV